MNECTLDQFPILRNCPHLFCMDCLHTYTKLEIHEGRVNLKCPQCNELIHPNGETILTTVQNIHEICLEQNLEFSRCSAFQECSELRVIKKSKNSKVNVQLHKFSLVFSSLETSRISRMFMNDQILIMFIRLKVQGVLKSFTIFQNVQKLL